MLYFTKIELKRTEKKGYLKVVELGPPFARREVTLCQGEMLCLG